MQVLTPTPTQAEPSHAEHHHGDGYLPLNRVEALTDGIFAVAMTLLVIELKLPEHTAVGNAHDLYQALLDLTFKSLAWVNSFFVLSLFWIGHHRAFSRVRRVDAKLVVLNLIELAFVSLMPFVSMMEGEYGTYWISQILYSTNMVLLSLSAIAVFRHIHRHPVLCSQPISPGRYHATRFRLGGLIVISVVAVWIAAYIPWPAAGNMAFVLMAVIGPMSRRLEQRTDAKLMPVVSTA